MESKIFVNAGQKRQGPTNTLQQSSFFNTIPSLYQFICNENNLKIVSQGGSAMTWLSNSSQNETPRVMHDIGIKAHGPQED